MTYSPLPPELQNDVDRVAFAYEPAVRAGRYENAFEAYNVLYNLLLTKQTAVTRYHKGYPLHNMGIVLYLQGDPDKALYYFILAYIEDLLSEEKCEEDRADQAPAGRTLRQAYSIKEELPVALKSIVRAKKERDVIVLDPSDILHEFARVEEAQKVVVSMAQKQPEIPPQVKRQPGKFDKDWEARVFVGGSYKEIAVINEIRNVIAARGYEPIVVRDFEVPLKMIHHHSLMLLHECKYAIFDLSQEAGQLMEMERVSDYAVTTLAVYRAEPGPEPKITEMVKTLLQSLSIPLKSYQDFEELRSNIHSFLPAPGLE